MNYLWAIFLIVTSLLGAYCASISNNGVKYGMLYTFLASIANVLIWTWVSRTSKHLFLDAVLYDIIVVIAYATGFIVLKYGHGFSILNWVGLILALSGLILLKV